MSEFEKAVTGLGEECGVFGAYDMDGHDVAASIYYGLFALQHRGQESCGIAVTDTAGKRKVLSRKGLGHVNDVFDEKVLSELKGEKTNEDAVDRAGTEEQFLSGKRDHYRKAP